ncbi:hypothetical protein WKH56_20805 [Priestia sp. SB1]|uniref:hypothetical protein n=1 Tax=Priestia sp. SB1 TaxID=3132359 RepID=UPI003181A6AB
MEKQMSFNANLSDVEKVNPLFSKCSVKVLYTGVNRNNSFFSKESVEKSIPTLFNVPIVGEFLDQEQNFGGHGGKLQVTEDSIKMVQTTRPFGVIPESANVYWENITESDGAINEYLIVDGAYLWTGRYSELDDLLANSYGQSMEIDVTNADFSVVDGKEVFKIHDFNFSALCILGIDKDGEGHVEPCFESASISTYSLNKDDFKKQFNQMLAELKFSLSEQKGGKTVDKKLELIAQYSLTEEQVKEKGINLEEYSLEELEVKLKEFAEVETVTETVEVEQDEETQEEKTDFSLVASQLREEIRAELYSEYTEDEWGYKERKFWYVDHDDSMIIAEDTSDSYRLVGIPYSVSDDKVSVDFEAKKKVKISYQVIEGDTTMEFSIASLDRTQYEVQVQEKKTEKEFSNKVEEVKSELENKTTEFNALNEEVKNLRNFKDAKVSEERTNSETELFGRFSSELTEEEINEIKAVASKFSLEELEEKLFTKVGKKKASFSKQPKKEKESIKIPLDFQDDEPKIVLYGDLFEKFGNK